MRITFVLPWAGMAGGIRVVAIYAERLAARGHRVTVISQPWRRAGWRQQVRSLRRGHGWLRKPTEGSHLDGLAVEHRVLERPRAVTDADVPDGDVVIATWWETAPWVAGLSARKGAKIHLVQGYDAVSYERVSAEAVARVHEAWRLPLEKVVVSRWLGEALGPFVQGQTVTCVPNSVDFEQFDAPVRGKQERLTAGFIYSEAPYKGTDVILAALERSRKEFGEVRIVSFGADPPRCLSLPGECEFHLVPPQERLRELYAACDVWLFASRQEGFGLPIVEAMACRTPVVATPAGAAPELLAGGGGVLVGMDDAAGMTRALGRIAEMDDEQWRGMSQRAYETVRGYSWDDATDRLESALHAAMARQSGRQAVGPVTENCP